jgi:hypothetical protein
LHLVYRPPVCVSKCKLTVIHPEQEPVVTGSGQRLEVQERETGSKADTVEAWKNDGHSEREMVPIPRTLGRKQVLWISGYNIQ